MTKEELSIERQNDIRRHVLYQNVFGTEEGKKVLADLLWEFGYWDHNPDFPDLRRAAIIILHRGGWIHRENIDAVVDGYLKAPQISDLEGLEEDEKEEDFLWRERKRTQRS